MIKGPEANQWREAMDVEMSQLNEMGTWKKEDLPEEWKAIGCRWVFMRKKDKHGKIVRYKACLVAQGFLQNPGTDDEIAPSPALEIAKSHNSSQLRSYTNYYDHYT